MADTGYTLRPRRRWTSGALVCVAMFALGGAVLWGLFLSPKPRPRPSPEVPWCVPKRPLRVVCLDGGEWGRNAEKAPPLIAPLDPDFVLVQNVPGRAAASLAEALGMQRSFHPGHFASAGRSDMEGRSLILSKHSLYAAAQLRPDVERPVSICVWAEAVVDGCRFAVASVDSGEGLFTWEAESPTVAAMLVDHQASRGNPPLLAAFRVAAGEAARAKFLQAAKLSPVGGAAGAYDADSPALSGVAVAGPWRSADAAGPATVVAPGIVLVEVNPR